MDLSLMQGQVIDHSYNAGYIVLSFLVSFVGCWTTLKLLHRRTSRHGYYNWYLLLGAAVAMGAVSIWSMHYIGNRAIIMADGARNIQIQYNAACTAGSFFLPICVVSIAFYLLGSSDQINIARVAMVGLLTGAAVCGMHYFGQGGISNYNVSYEWPYVLGSAFIAVTAATIALGVFFYFKATWTNNWLRRALCAAVLAASVSGMHWVATVGTIYRYKPGKRKGDALTRQATVVVVLCLAIGCCIALLTFAIIGQRVKSRSAHRAQQVVLASVIFDSEGKLMVLPEGRLPCRKIANTSMDRSFDEIFDTNHPVFAWIYRASHYWPAVAGLIPGFRAHLGVRKHRQMSQVGVSGILAEQMTVHNLDDHADFGTEFKELFCVAASDLAESIHEPLREIGVLWQSIMLTGTIERPRKLQLFARSMATNPHSNAEYGRMHPAFGRGQLLFLVRRVNKRDAVRLQAAGFHFANLTYIIPSLAQSMEVTVGELSTKLHKIQRYLSEQFILEPGVHIACYALRPKIHGGWDILINKEKRNLLPTVQLTTGTLQPWQAGCLKELDNLTVRDCFQYLRRRQSDPHGLEQAFLSLVDQSISLLAAHIDHPLFERARFMAQPYLVPCRTSVGSQHRGKATVLMFRVIVDAHYSSPLNGRFEFGSSRLFRAQQHVYPASPDHGAFARQVHLEFAGLAEGRVASKVRSSMTSGPSSPRKHSKSSQASSPIESPVTDNDKHKSPFSESETSFGELDLGNKKNNRVNNVRGYFGGIHVQNDISVDVSEVPQRQQSGQSFELDNLGVHSEVTVAPMETDTFADELMLLLIEERRQQSARGHAS